MGFLVDLFWKIRGPRVYALVGESGTGKSHIAQALAYEHGIPLIIDDGILIEGDKILAGKTAKREKTFLGAVKVALFDDKEHRDEVAKALQKHKAHKLLIIGTSEKMVNKIAIRLQIPRPHKIMKIEDVSSPEDIKAAKIAREIEGKHVIPVPVVQVKKRYSQIFSDKLKVLFERDKNNKSTKYKKQFEKSLVRPEFSKVGGSVIEMSENELRELIRSIVFEYDSKIYVKKIKIRTDENSYQLVLTIDVPFDTQLTGHMDKLQKHIIKTLEYDTGVIISNINIVIDKILTQL